MMYVSMHFKWMSVFIVCAALSVDIIATEIANSQL